MNMSDDVTGVTLQIVQKGADVAAHAAKEFIDLLTRLFAELGREHERKKANAASSPASSKSEKPSVSSTDLTDIKTGKVDLKKLRENARAIGDTLSMSENALTQEDKQFISKKAKAYGIPVAFSNENSKNYVFASVRTSDLPLFKQICTEMMKSKIARHPQKLGNFNCDAWEIPFLTAHLKKRDLSAQFIQTSAGKNLCVFDEKQQLAFKMVREDFVAQCSEVQKELAFDRDESGFITIKHLRSGKEISFDDIPNNKKSLAAKIQEAFGYDEIKAEIAAARFGEEMLQGSAHAEFFEDSAQRECTQVETNVFLSKNDSDNNPINIDPLPCRAYQCWRVIPKSDERPRLVYQNDEGDFAVLEPTKMTRAQMRHALTTQLGITDRKTQDALIYKAESIESHYAQKEAHTAEYVFSKNDFDLSDVRVAMGLRKTDEQGNTIYTKQLPISSMSSEINRTEKDYFRVDSTVTSVEKDANGVNHERHDTQQLVLSFSDKKSSLQRLQEMYVAQGVPDHVAKKMAKDVFRNAEMQNPDKPIQIQEVREKAMTVAYGIHSAEVSTTDKQAAASKIAEQFGVPVETAEIIVEKAEEMKIESVQERVTIAQETKTDFNTAMNRMTERGENKLDNMVVCSADDPAKHIVVTGTHNGDRVIHEYTAYNGEQRVGTFTDAHTKDEYGVPITEENGRHAWTNVKEDMRKQSHITGEVLTFETVEAYHQYLEDTAMLAQSDSADSEAAGISAETLGLNENTVMGSNGHEAHPEGNILGEAAAGIGKGGAPAVPVPELPLPELPPPSMGGRR